MAEFGLCEEILFHIEASKRIEFASCSSKGLWGHQAIVLKFDRFPVFTIDYGPEGGCWGYLGISNPNLNRRSASYNQILGAPRRQSYVDFCAIMMPGSDQRVYGFDLSKIKTINPVIASLALDSPEKKKFVTDLMVEIANIKMGEYSLFSNNCQHFVQKAEAVIEEASIRYYRQFRNPWFIKFLVTCICLLIGIVIVWVCTDLKETTPMLPFR